MAVVSSFLNVPVGDKVIAVGEVGLSGEVRAVSMIEQRVSEAVKLGFETVVIPKVCADRVKGIKGCKIIGIESVSDAIRLIKEDV
jgi:DNA repair protein RadA/Sms